MSRTSVSVSLRSPASGVRSLPSPEVRARTYTAVSGSASVWTSSGIVCSGSGMTEPMPIMMAGTPRSAASALMSAMKSWWAWSRTRS